MNAADVLKRTLSFTNESYPLRELLGSFRRDGNARDKTETKAILNSFHKLEASWSYPSRTYNLI